MAGHTQIISAGAETVAVAEKVRRRQVRKLLRLQYVLIGSFSVFFGTIIAAANVLLPMYLSILLVIGALTTAFAAGAIYYYDRRDLQIALKQHLLAPLAQQLDGSLQFLPKQGFSSSDLLRSSLFPDNGQLQSSDLLRGRYGQTDFVSAFVEVHQAQRRGRKQSLAKFDQNRVAFSGLMIIADSNKHIKGRTLVLPDYLEAYLGRWLSKQLSRLRHTRLENAELEDPDFERAFEVYTTDQVEARYLLTPDMMKRILTLQAELKRELRIAYFRDRVYIAIDRVDPIELDVFRPVAGHKLEEPIREQWALIRKVIDGLQLNERIWAKE